LIAGILGACNTLPSQNQPQNIAIENAQAPVSIADYGSTIGFKGGGGDLGGLANMKYVYEAADYI
jgi:Ca-activated chloride channel homolog